MRKKKILINTDYPNAKTGLGRNGKEIALYLHNTGKYEVIYYACGMIDHHPDFARYPFKIRGCLPAEQHLIDQLNKDPNLGRAAAYGDYRMEQILKEEKPDIIIVSNDSWATSLQKRVWFDKIKSHFIPHITLDSLPFLDDQIEMIKKSEKMVVWADFAVEEAKRLGYNHLQRISASISKDNFKRLDDFDRKELRKKFNLPEDAFICGFVFRNQLRKEVRSLMEGFSIFCKENLDIKNPYLLLHTSISEGWSIDKFCEEFNIDKKKVLLTYICRNCNEIEVRHLQGHDLDCRFCSAQKSQITCNVGFGCTEDQLNQVYNLMDCYFHPNNAAGVEMPIPEALYCEIPVATTAYAGTKMFTDQSFVQSIDFSWSVQIGTQFKRACPSAFSIAKIMKKFINTPKDKIREIGKKGREWAIQNFAPENLGKQWESLIDSIPFCDWDYNFAPDPKNDQFPMPNIDDNDTFIKTLYKEILKMDVDSNDGGYKNWEQALKNGQSKQAVYEYFINVAKQENSKNPQNQISFDSLLSPNENRVLLVAKESAGDIFIMTSLFKSIKEKYPDYDLYVATEPKFFDILIGNEYIHKVIPYQPFMENEMICCGYGQEKGWFKVYMHPAIGTQRILNYLSNDKINLELNY